MCVIGRFQKEVVTLGNNLMKPGFTRLSLHYILTKYELVYIIYALKFLCNHGYKFLPFYEY